MSNFPHKKINSNKISSKELLELAKKFVAPHLLSKIALHKNSTQEIVDFVLDKGGHYNLVSDLLEDGRFDIGGKHLLDNICFTVNEGTYYKISDIVFNKVFNYIESNVPSGNLLKDIECKIAEANYLEEAERIVYDSGYRNNKKILKQLADKIYCGYDFVYYIKYISSDIDIVNYILLTQSNHFKYDDYFIILDDFLTKPLLKEIFNLVLKAVKLKKKTEIIA